MKSITVFCSSSIHLDSAFHDIARLVGHELARRRIRLVYGGGGVGLMGELARSARDDGGEVLGIITQSLLDREAAYDRCHELIVVQTMRERKRLMMKHGDAFLILPGGMGTYEEFFEVITARIVGEHTKPIGVANAKRYYDPMIEMIDHGIEHRFIKPAVHELLQVDEDPVRVIDALHAAKDVALHIDDDRLLPMGRDVEPTTRRSSSTPPSPRSPGQPPR